MRYFFSTGEASGELVATLIAREIKRLDPQAQFEGIGGGRMRAERFELWRDHRGWATFGPFEAIPRVPKMIREMRAAAAHVASSRPDCVVLVDFGAFNIRLARAVRTGGYGGPIVDVFPPSAWLDRETAARAVADVALPVPAFARQRDFFARLGLPVWFFGHPLAGQYTQRAPRPPAPSGGGTVALLPGSRPGEIRRHVPLLASAYTELRRIRPAVRAVIGAAAGANDLSAQFARAGLPDLPVLAGVREATADADGAFVASGTAVLECVLLGVPVVAYYKLSPLLALYGALVYGRRRITIPNLVLEREAVPEFLHDKATPQALAATMDAALANPAEQYGVSTELRDALGPADALERIAAFIVERAQRC